MCISQLESDIRNHINHPRKYHELLIQFDDWNVLCSALDVIGDTERGLEAYLKSPKVDDVGLRYLYVYGVLQLLQTQQDAVISLCKALNINESISSTLSKIREIRSSAVGHPTKGRENKVLRSNFIQRITLSHLGFTMMTVYSNDQPYSMRRVKIGDLIQEQRGTLKKTLEKVIQTLNEEEMAHREKFRGKKLSDAFPPTMGYYFEKIYEATRDQAYFTFGKAHIEIVSDCLEEFKLELTERGEWGIHESIDYEYDLLSYPIDKLKKFFAHQEESEVNEKDAYIFSRFVEQEIKFLQKIAKELDEQYASPIKNKR